MSNEESKKKETTLEERLLLQEAELSVLQRSLISISESLIRLSHGVIALADRLKEIENVVKPPDKNKIESPITGAAGMYG